MTFEELRDSKIKVQILTECAGGSYPEAFTLAHEEDILRVPELTKWLCDKGYLVEDIGPTGVYDDTRPPGFWAGKQAYKSTPAGMEYAHRSAAKWPKNNPDEPQIVAYVDDATWKSDGGGAPRQMSGGNSTPAKPERENQDTANVKKTWPQPDGISDAYHSDFVESLCKCGDDFSIGDLERKMRPGASFSTKHAQTWIKGLIELGWLEPRGNSPRLTYRKLRTA